MFDRLLAKLQTLLFLVLTHSELRLAKINIAQFNVRLRILRVRVERRFIPVDGVVPMQVTLFHIARLGVLHCPRRRHNEMYSQPYQKQQPHNQPIPHRRLQRPGAVRPFRNFHPGHQSQDRAEEQRIARNM